MSGAVKAVKKVFKKVTKVVKKVAPFALAAGALLFTGGAALGLAPAGVAGGWGGAAASISSSLGATGTIGSALTGAITQAGYGALSGGAIAGLTGGDITKGMQTGALTGAATGGVMGGMGMQTDPFSGIGQETVAGGGVVQADGSVVWPDGTVTNPLPPKPSITLESLPPQGLDQHAIEAGAREGLWAAPQSSAPGASAASPAATAPPASGGSGGGGLLSNVFKEGGWLERNQALAGGVVRGVGQSLMGMADSDAEKDAMRERYRLAARNYEGTNPGAQYASFSPGTSSQTPTERFDPRIYGSYEYQFDPKVGRIVRVPVNSA